MAEVLHNTIVRKFQVLPPSVAALYSPCSWIVFPFARSMVFQDLLPKFCKLVWWFHLLQESFTDLYPVHPLISCLTYIFKWRLLNRVCKVLLHMWLHRQGSHRHKWPIYLHLPVYGWSWLSHCFCSKSACFVVAIQYLCLRIWLSLCNATLQLF